MIVTRFEVPPALEDYTTTLKLVAGSGGAFEVRGPDRNSGRRRDRRDSR